MRTEACERCGAPVQWVMSEVTGARVKLDPEPKILGTVVTRQVGGRGLRFSVLCQKEATGARGAGRETYRFHHERCPITSRLVHYLPAQGAT